jgi:nitrogen regulatory protein PII
MYYMVLLVLDDAERSHDLLDAWEKAGAGGVTVWESTGLGRIRQAGLRDDVPLMPSLAELLRQEEERHRTLFTVVKDEAMVDRLIEAVTEVAGNLNEPNTGVLFVLPVVRAIGLDRPAGT